MRIVNKLMSETNITDLNRKANLLRLIITMIEKTEHNCHAYSSTGARESPDNEAVH